MPRHLKYYSSNLGFAIFLYFCDLMFSSIWNTSWPVSLPIWNLPEFFSLSSKDFKCIIGQIFSPSPYVFKAFLSILHVFSLWIGVLIFDSNICLSLLNFPSTMSNLVLKMYFQFLIPFYVVFSFRISIRLFYMPLLHCEILNCWHVFFNIGIIVI